MYAVCNVVTTREQNIFNLKVIFFAFIQFTIFFTFIVVCMYLEYRYTAGILDDKLYRVAS